MAAGLGRPTDAKVRACWSPALALLTSLPMTIGQYMLAPTPSLALVLGLLVYITLNCWMPPQAAIAQSLVSADNRALAAACILATAGTGSALGPFLTGVLSDFLTPTVGSDAAALQYAVAAIAVTDLLASACFAATRHMAADLKRTAAT